LKDEPKLWSKFHDENLIFTKEDFDNPRRSELFAKIRAIGPEHRLLADALDKACREDPTHCPSTLDLVGKRPSKLPAWMLQAPTVTVRQATREAKPGTPSAAGAHTSSAANYTSVQQAQASVTSSGFLQPKSSTAPQATATKVSTPQMSAREVAGWTLTYAFVGLLVIWFLVPLVRLLFLALGASSEVATRAAVLTYLAACVGLGYRKAKEEARPKISTQVPSPAAPAKPASARLFAPSATHGSAVAYGSTAPPPPLLTLLGSKVRLVYHKPNCRWTIMISHRNRIQFGSIAEAKAAGYRPCSDCSP
jgi:hypothetical protein